MVHRLLRALLDWGLRLLLGAPSAVVSHASLSSCASSVKRVDKADPKRKPVKLTAMVYLANVPLLPTHRQPVVIGDPERMPQAMFANYCDVSSRRYLDTELEI